jgi:transposase
MTDSAVLELPGMPAPAPLELVESDGKCLVRRGSSVLFAYDADDLGMRNLAIVALTEAGVEAKVAVGEAAAVFALTPTYVSMLRGRARKEGSAGLVKRMGRPAKLSARQVEQARRWSGEGFTQQEIASRLGVHQSQISLLLARRGPIAPQPELPQPASGEEELRVDGLCADTGTVPESEPELGVARVGCGVVECRYAGAMLGHAFFSRIGAGAVFAGLDTGARVRFDDAALLCATTLAFGLGVSSLEGAKHLNRREAGALAGLTALPHLRILRPRLAAIADACDPLAVQRDLAGAMLSADAPALDVYFVDDHFVSYGGAKPLGKGWNNKRKQAQKGHGDTLLTDWRGRAVVFLTGEPSGLTTTLPAALEQLRAVTGPDAKLMLGFDRGGAYASVFSACRDEKVDWITYRRGKLKSTLVKPTTYPYPPAEAEAEAEAEAGRGEVVLSDEIVEFKDYGPCRQLTLFEDGVMRLQVLTSDLGADAASLLAWLRARWRIENAIKDLARIYGIDWLCDYRAVEVPDDAQVDNPVRKAARRTVTDREADLQTAERALARLLESPT